MTNLMSVTRLSTLSVLLAACGGASEASPPPAAPPPQAEAAPVAPAAPVVAPAPKPTMAELQKRYVETELALFNAHDAAKYGELYAVDAVTVAPGAKGLEETKGREAIQKSMTELFAGMPDLKSANVRILTGDNVVVQQWVAVGTHQGEFAGLRPSGKPVGLNGISISWFNEDGLVTRSHAYYDQGTMASQIGASKAPARPVPTLPAAPAEWVTMSGSELEKKNGDLVKEFFSTFGKKDVKAFTAFLAPDSTYSDFTQPQDVTTIAGMQALFNQHAKAFPDVNLTVTNAWAFGDYVVVECTGSGTHKGQLGPIKATGKPVTLHFGDVMRLKDGKIAQGWSYGSSLELLNQLGMLK